MTCISKMKALLGTSILLLSVLDCNCRKVSDLFFKKAGTRISGFPLLCSYPCQDKNADLVTFDTIVHKYAECLLTLNASYSLDTYAGPDPDVCDQKVFMYVQLIKTAGPHINHHTPQSRSSRIFL